MTGILQGLIGSLGGATEKGVQSYLDPGTYSFTIPTGVYSLNIMGIGAGGGGTRRSGSAPRGGGGGGGSLITCNGISVTGGNTIWVSVGSGGAGGNGASGTAGGATEVRHTNSGGTLIFTAGGGSGATFNSTSAAAGGTRTTNAQGTYGGGDGGAGGSGNNGTSGGGGAGGYTGTGGAGGSGTTTQTAGTAGSGGGGGGAGAAGNTSNYQSGGGGGTGAFGSGSNGAGGTLITSTYNPGGGGSDGSDGYPVGTGTGGFWGGGGGGSSLGSGAAASGKGGACVITWGPPSMEWPTPAFPASLDHEDIYDWGTLSASADYRLNSNGNVEQGLGGSFSSIGTWLVDGVNSDYECRVDILTGAIDSGTTGTWLALSTTRTWSISVAGQYVGQSAWMFVQIRKAAAPNSVVAAAFVNLEALSEGTL